MFSVVAAALAILAADSVHLRVAVAETALAQVDKPDPAWQPEQRDCAGLVRFAYRTAYKKLRPERLRAPLWSADGRPADFADAESLLSGSFVALGRGASARASLRSGDLVGFRQGTEDDPIFHLMIVVAEDDPAHGALVVYHPGTKSAAVRLGQLDSLAKDAPHEWRPVPENGAFLGFYRYKEWVEIK